MAMTPLDRALYQTARALETLSGVSREPDSNNTQSGSASRIEYVADNASPFATTAALAAPSGSSLVGFIQSGTGAVVRTLQEKAREVVSVADYGADATGAVSSTGAFTNAGSDVEVGAGIYLLSTSPTLDGPYRWRKSPDAVFIGAPILANGLVGFNYNPDLRYNSTVDSRGTSSSPVTDAHAVSAIVKHTDAAYPGAGVAVPAFYVANNKYMSAPGDRVQAIYAEAIERVGGVDSFVEAGRFHAINALGGSVGGDVYGVIAYAQSGAGANDPANKYTVGMEAEVARINGSNAVSPTNWTAANNLDTMFNASVQQGKKPLAAYLVNPYNQIAVQCGFMVGNSNAAQGSSKSIVTYASFGSFEDNVTFGLAVRGANIYAAVSVANEMTILRARNAANTADHALLRYDSSNFLVMGQEASAIVAFAPLRQYLPASVAPVVNGELVVEATSNTSLTFKYRGSDGTTRTGALAVA